MYIKAQIYTINHYGDPVAHVTMKIHPITFRSKAEIELKNGESFIMKAGAVTSQEFEKRIYREVMYRLNL